MSAHSVRGAHDTTIKRGLSAPSLGCTAYRTSVATDALQSGPREMFVSVTDAQGVAVAPPVGRVLDPAVIPYADRAKAKAGTVMWTFALAFPKTGGPYYVKTESGVDILWALTP